MQLKESFQTDLTLYRSAQDLFEAAREAARDTECIAKQVQSMQLFEGVKAQQSSIVSSKKAIIDRMILTDKRGAMIFVALWETHMPTCYGRYLRHAKRSDVVTAVHHSRSWCCRAKKIAFDVIDSVGLADAAEGRFPISKTR